MGGNWEISERLAGRNYLVTMNKLYNEAKLSYYPAKSIANANYTFFSIIIFLQEHLTQEIFGRWINIITFSNPSISLWQKLCSSCEYKRMAVFASITACKILGNSCPLKIEIPLSEYKNIFLIAIMYPWKGKTVHKFCINLRQQIITPRFVFIS